MRLLFILLALLATNSLMSQNFQDEWESIEELRNQGRYRTALEEIEALYLQTRATDQADQQAKAIFYRTAMLRELEEDGTEAAISQLRSDIESNPDPRVLPVLHLQLAKGYRSYLQQRFRQLRDQTALLEENTTPENAREPELPLAEWSLERLARAMTQQLVLSLETSRTTRTELREMEAIVVPGENLPGIRPTIYDLIVYEALQELPQGLNQLPDPVDAFKIEAASLLADANDFLTYQPTTTDTLDLRYRQLKIYQDLIAYRTQIARVDLREREALVDAELSRFQWANEITNDVSAYHSALERLFREYSGATNRGDVAFALAELKANHEEYWGDTEEEQRLRLSRDRDRYQLIISDYPNSQAAEMAQQRIRQIEQQSLRTQTDEVALPKQPVLVGISYRNLEQLHYRLVKLPYELGSENNRDRRSQQQIVDELLTHRALQQGRFDLAENDDYLDHQTEFALEGLEPGKYALLVSNTADFKLDKGYVASSKFVVSQLAVLQIPGNNRRVEMQVVNRETGMPISGVQVEQYTIKGYNRNIEFLRLDTKTTGLEGKANFQRKDNRQIWVLTYNGDRLEYNTNAYYDNGRREAREQVLFFLDRSIYRPGQRLQGKAIRIAYDKDGLPSLATNQSFQVQLLDANYEEVDQLTLRTDAYGTAKFDFELPTSRLSGYWRLNAGNNGNTGFRVEEYKRPKFEIKLPTPDETAELGEAVVITGTALGYAGPAVSGGRVNYRVERQISYWSYNYWGRGSGRTSAILAQGETTTNDQGEFEIEFVADPGETNGAGYRRPHYQFIVYVDVSDGTGETHAAETYVPVRQKFLRLQVNLPAEAATQDEVNLTLGVPDGLDDALTVDVSLEPVSHPDPSLLDRKWPAPDRPLLEKANFKTLFPDLNFAPPADLGDWTSAGTAVFQRRLNLLADTNLLLPVADLTAGHYRLQIRYTDLEGEQQTIYQPLALYDFANAQLPAGMLSKSRSTQGPQQVGNEVEIELLHQEDIQHALGGWVNRSTDLAITSVNFGTDWQTSHTITEADRGGRLYYLQYIYKNRYHQGTFRFDVPWRNKELAVEYETFRDKLRPGEEETWTLRVSDLDGNPVDAQLLASMYDASLDAINAHAWNLGGLYPSLQWWPRLNNSVTFGNQQGYGQHQAESRPAGRVYTKPYFNFGPLQWGYGYGRGAVMRNRMQPMAMDADMAMESSAPPPPPAPGAGGAEDNLGLLNLFSEAEESNASFKVDDDTNESAAPPPSIRTNLQETAFFQPEILTDAEGRANIHFTSPEALTSWKLQVLAHTQELAYVLSTQEIVTQKELMILPNAPRFLREGDRMEFSAKVSNLSDQVLTGSAELELFNLETEAPINLDYGLTSTDRGFRIEAGGSQVVQWRIAVPEGAAQQGQIGYRVIARSGNFSDGEQSSLPVLTNRIFLTATESFYLRGRDRKTVTLDALANANSNSLRHEGFSFELTSNPAWLAVKSLPYLTEYPYNCSEQLVNRFFANQLSFHIVNSKPQLRSVFEQWKGDADALTSELQQNQDLKEALLEETPWMREAEDEAQQRQRLGLLFDLNAVAQRQQETLTELTQRQNSDGSFSWFPAGRPNRYVTAYVLESLVRLQLLGAIDQNTTVQVDEIINRGTTYLDGEVAYQFNRWLNGRELTDSLKATYEPSSSDIHFIYLRAGYLRKSAIPNNLQLAWTVMTERLKTSWVNHGLYEQALICSAFGRMDDPAVAAMILTSLRERALRSDELGMYWKYGQGYRWQELPIETHCRIQEAFLYNGGSVEELDEMRLWLLQNKRTNRWSSTKSTAAAVFALLQHNNDWLSDNNEIKVSFPNAATAVWQAPLSEAESGAEAGTGYYRMQLPATAVSPALATVQLRNKGRSISWGAMYWQFTEDIDRVIADNDGPLGLDRTVFRRVNTDQGERLEAITNETRLRTGDRLRVQLVIRSDREMDFVHLKDRRAASLEPTEQLSGYRYTSGLGYYFSPSDVAVNFFIDRLPRGIFTLEYDLFVTQEGDFSNGLSQIQCMYAPELAAYTSGGRLEVE